MSRSIQIRNVPDRVHRTLRARAAAAGRSLSDYLLDVEVIHALRGLVHGGKISEEIAADVRMDFADLAVVRYPRVPLSDRMWELRHAMTAYDAAFVALSEALGAPLVTCDSRLAATSSHSARIELFPPA
jgi:predicted nucleic acid-binding protein